MKLRQPSAGNERPEETRVSRKPVRKMVRDAMRSRLGFLDGALWAALLDTGGSHALTLHHEINAVIWFAWTLICVLRWANWRNDEANKRALLETE